MIPEEDQKDLPEDENTPDKRAEKVWDFFGKKEDGNFDCEEFPKCDENFWHERLLMSFAQLDTLNKQP